MLPLLAAHGTTSLLLGLAGVGVELSNLFAYDWELPTRTAGAQQWTPKDGAGAGTVPDAHDPKKSHAPTRTPARS